MQTRKDHKSLIKINWTVGNEHLQTKYNGNFSKSVSKEKSKRSAKRDDQNILRASKNVKIIGFRKSEAGFYEYQCQGRTKHKILNRAAIISDVKLFEAVIQFYESQQHKIYGLAQAKIQRNLQVND